MLDKRDFKTIITSEKKLFDLHIAETFRYRDLIFLFVKREFTSKYKQTILGPAWAIVQPLLTTVVFSFVFGSLAGLTTADVPGSFTIPAFLFYMSGSICWTYFSNTLRDVSNTFLVNRETMGKVYYPRLAAPVSTAFSNLISLGIQLMLFLCFWLFFLLRGGTDICISFRLFLIPLCILQMIILSIGSGIIIAAVTTKYRDLAMLVVFGLQLWQYASPVAYGLALVSERKPQFMWLYMLNPMTPLITTFRYAFFGSGYFNLTYYLISWGVSLLVFFLGLILFSRIERTFTDTV